MSRSSLTRRQLLGWAGLGTAFVFHPPLVGGCSGSKPGSSSASDDLPPLEFDPDRPWWLQHNYAPVGEERDAVDLAVEGAIPPELDGLYVRNGSNPASGTAAHWFLGDGMVHGVRLQGGRALWYKNRYVETPLLEAGGRGDEIGPPELSSNASNVSLIEHAGRLLSLGEIGFPFELSPEDLSTRSVYTFDGRLETAMTAHPKIDAQSGEMLMFGYWFAPPFLTFHQVDRAGALIRSEPIDLPASVMMHDFQITATRVLFMDLPILFDLDSALEGEIFPFRWDASHGARLGIMPRNGGNAEIQWLDIEPCYIFHTLNAFDDPVDPNVVVLEAVRHPTLWVDGPNAFDSRPSLHRYHIDLASESVIEAPIDDRLIEFPQLDRRLAGRPHRYGYALWLNEPTGEPLSGMRGILKYDHESDRVTAHELDRALQPDEALFVPASDGSGEDEGFLLSYVYDRAEDRTSLFIFDASRLEANPIARVRLPFRVPFGFHGTWVPAG